METGFITLHRKILKHPLWQNANTRNVFIQLLMLANYQESKFWYNEKEYKLKRGQVIIGRRKLAKECGLDENTVYYNIKLLEKQQVINIQSNSKFSIITIVKYDDYQLRPSQSNSQLTAGYQPINSQLTQSNKEISKLNNNKEMPKGIRAKPYSRKKPDPDISEIILYLKKSLGLTSLDGELAWNRIYAGHLLRRFKGDKIKVERFIDFALQDPFHRKNATNVKYLFNNINKIAMAAKSQSQSIVDI